MAALAFLVLLVLLGLATFASPGWPFRALGLVLGLLPFARLVVVPGTVLLLVTGLCWCALATGSLGRPRPTKPVVLTGLLLATGALSLLGTGVGGEAVTDYVRWGLVTSVVVPVLVAGPGLQAALARSFVYATTVAGALGVLLLRLDPEGRFLARVGVVETDAFGGNLRVVRFTGGDVQARLTGVWLDPNVAGLMMTGALLLALALLRGRTRVVCSAVLVLAIALTLSRAALGSIVVGGLLLVLASGLARPVRTRLGLLGLGIGAALLALPSVRARLLDSFSSSDVGSHARWQALVDLPDQMAGHWLFGRGWGLPELLEGSIARFSNYPANAALLTLYRGGILLALAFVALLGLLLVRGWRLLRRPVFEEAVLGAGAVSLVLVAFQLDFPVVTIIPAVVLLSLLVAFTSPGVPPATQEAS